MTDSQNPQQPSPEQQPGFETPRDVKQPCKLPPGGDIPDPEPHTAEAEKQDLPVAGSKNKGTLGRLFNAAAAMVVGATASLAVKTVFCAVAATAGAPVVVTALTAAALGGAASNFALQKLAQRKARKSGETVPEFSKKKLLGGAAMGLIGGGVLLAFGDTISDAVCKFFGGGVAADSVTTAGTESVATPPAPAVIVDTPVETETVAPQTTEVPQTDPYAGMTAQQIKDQAFRLFNDGNAANDAQAVEMFRKAAEMGNHGAKIDLAYIEHWGLAGVPKDDFGSIEHMYNTLEDMDSAGVAHRPDLSHKPEYERGFKLLEQWLGTGYDPSTDPALADLDAVSAQHTQETMMRELTEQEDKAINGATPQSIVTDTETPTQNAAPVTEPALPDAPKVDENGMVELEFSLDAGKSGVNCENGWAMIHGGDGNIDFACPMSPGSEMPPIGSSVIVTPPKVVAPLFGR